MRPWPLVALSLLFMAITARGDTLESNHAIIEYEPQDVAYAQIVADTIDQMFWPTYQFYSGIGTMAPEPEKVPVNLDSALLALQQTVYGLVDLKINAATERDGDWAINIDPEAVVNADGLRTTVVHELFHHMSFRSGVVNADDIEQKKHWWVLEGTAEVAEYALASPYPHKKSRFISYLQKSEHHQAVGLQDAKHHAAFFVYYLWQQDPDSFRNLMAQFGSSRDGAMVAQSLAVGQHWYEFTKAMFNRSPATPILVDGGPLANSSGDNYTPNFAIGATYPIPAEGAVDAEVTLPPLSWQHAMLNVHPSLPWFNVHFGELGDATDFIAHAFIKDSNTGEYRYEDWSGETSRRICLKSEGPCANENLDKVSKVVLILANRSLTESLTGTLAAGSLDQRWKLTEMQVSQDLIVPALGTLTLEFGTNGGMLVRSKGWWLKFPKDHFPDDTSALAYQYINRACRFKGYVKFRRDTANTKIEYQSNKDREQYIWPTRRVEKGGMTNTPSGWWCDFRTEMATMAAVPPGAGMPAAGVIARVFTDLNTTEYPPGSFAGNLSAIMKAMMSLQVPAYGDKDVKAFHELGNPRRLRVELQGNVRAWFEPFP